MVMIAGISFLVATLTPNSNAWIVGRFEMHKGHVQEVITMLNAI